MNGATHNAAGYWEFDGVDDKIIGPPCNTILSADSSIELWVNLDDVTTRQTIISGYDSVPNTNPDRWDFEMSSGTFRGGFHDTGFFTSSTAISIGDWNHVMLVLNSSTNTLKFYLNGVEDLSQSCSGQDFGGPDINLGIGNRNESVVGPMDGDIGEVRIYPRALTAAQVFQNYNATKSKYTTSRASTSPKITTNPIVMNSNLLLNYDFGNDFCIEKSSNVSTSNYQFILDNATTNGAAFGDGQCVSTGYGKVVVGARGETNGIYSAGGKAFVYNSSTGVLEVTLTPSDILGNDWNFGNSVAICNCSGKIAVSSNNALYLYDADGTNEIIINESSTLPIIPPGGNTFGNGLAISGNRVWVSDDNVPSGVSYSGTVYCFNAETGAFIYELRPKNILDNFTRYGSVIAAGGGKLAIGAENITHPVTGRSTTGRVYLYDVDGRNEKIIEPDILTTNSYFGFEDIAIDYGMIVVGASRQQRFEDPGAVGSGEVYVFDIEGDLKFSIRPSDDPAIENNDYFGFGSSVAVSSDRIIVGARYYAGNAGGVAGRAYQFTHKGKELQAWFGIGDGEPVVNGSGFGSSMDAVGGTLVIGAGSGSSDSSGRAYVYPLTGTPSGNILNLSSNSYTGTINGATFNSAGYFDLDGTDDGMTVNSLANFTNITVEWWGTSDYPDTTYRVPVMKTTNTAWTDGFGFYQQSGVVSWWVNQWNGTGATETQSATTSFGFTHWVGTYDGSNVKLYRNGVLEDTVSYTTAMTNPNVTFDIGNSKNSYSWDGNIGQVRIYDTALTATEVLQNFNATKSKYGL